MSEEVLGTFIEVVDGEIGVENHWKVIRVGEIDLLPPWQREFELVKRTPNGKQGWVAGHFSREGLAGLRDLLTEVLETTV